MSSAPPSRETTSRGVTLPICLLTGGESVPHGRAISKLLVDLLPNVRHVDLAGAGHAPYVDGGGGSPERLGDGFITVAGAMGPNPNLVLNDREADSLIWRLLHPVVATVDVVLTDGRVITTPAQDGYGFSENFFLVAFPTRTGGGMELLSTIVARDGAGNELARTEGPE
jgi:hypothetical protein